LISDRNKGNKI